MIRTFTLLFAAALMAESASAQDRPAPERPAAEDHLAPANTQLRAHDKQVNDVLKDAFASNVVLRAIVYPSIGTEYAVGLKKDGGAYHVFSLATAQKMWLYTVVQKMKHGKITAANSDGTDDTQEEIARLEKTLPAAPKDVPAVDRCEIAVGARLATRLAAVWKRMLLRTRIRTSPQRGLDGETYFFSMPMGRGELRGQVWSPRENTKTGMLVGIMYDMREACRKHDRKMIAGLRRQVRALERRL